MKDSRNEQSVEVRNMNFDIDGILQVAKNFIDLSKVYLRKQEYVGTSREPKFFTFRGLPSGFAMCLKMAIGMYNQLRENDVQIINVEQDFTVKL